MQQNSPGKKIPIFLNLRKYQKLTYLLQVFANFQHLYSFQKNTIAQASYNIVINKRQ
jgi:hypothetical protein